jgi:hypothetical protein
MTEVTTEDLRMRQFLLGELGEQEREELEQRVLAEASIRDKLLMAEDDLIEEYLEGFLKGGERENFLRQFLAIPHQRNKLKLAKSLRRFSRNEANIDTVHIAPHVFSEAVIETVPTERGRISEAGLDTVPIEPLDTVGLKPRPFGRKLLVYAPIAAVVLVAVTIGSVWYVKYRRSATQRQAIERELAQLNTSGKPNLPSDQTYMLIVPPTSTTNIVSSIPSTFKGPVVELWLLPRKQTEHYNALLQKEGSQDQFQISNLHFQNGAGGRVVLLRISTRLLTAGVYRVQLNGLSTDGRVVGTDEYSFKIE